MNDLDPPDKGYDMNGRRSRYDNPSLIDRLAAAYVAGTLQGPARRRLERIMQRQPALVLAVNEWTERLGPLHVALPPHAVSAGLWPRIAASIGMAPPSSTITSATVARAGEDTSWWRRLFAPIPAAALAMGLALGSVAPALWQTYTAAQRGMELPDSYVGVLSTADGKPGLIISSLRQGRVVDVKQVTAVEVPEGQTLYLWRIDKAGAIAAVGALPKGKFTHLTLGEPAEKLFFTAVELAVSIEPSGTTPVVPSQRFVYRGLCGKLWR